MFKPPKLSDVNALSSDSFIGGELQQLIRNNEILYKKNQEFRDILRKAVIAIEGKQVYSFGWQEWADMAKKALKP